MSTPARSWRSPRSLVWLVVGIASSAIGLGLIARAIDPWNPMPEAKRRFAERKVAWTEATRTAWKSAGDALDRAAAADSADARTPAYRSVVAAGAGDAAARSPSRRACPRLPPWPR